MMQLIQVFLDLEYQIDFATTASAGEKSEGLGQFGIHSHSIELNNSNFDEFVKQLSPNVVLFDRYITEEQFGWRVAEQCPQALRILDTEDVHFLRKAREVAHKKNHPLELYTDRAKRELASILRSDVSLIVSSAEMKLLDETFHVPLGILHYLPIWVDKLETDFPSFETRKDFITLGNFQHAPNTSSVIYLKKTIWPLIRKQLPEAKLHIYGAYAPKSIADLHNEQEGFLIKGWAPSVKEVMTHARVCLAPLQYGAGLKGKLLDAACFGTPSVTTTIGNEGLFTMNLVEDSPEAFAEKAISLYTQENLWMQQQKEGRSALEKHFMKQSHVPTFVEKVQELRKKLPSHRNQHFLGQIFHEQTLQATKYMSKWIELKNMKEDSL